MHHISAIRKTCAGCQGRWVQFETPWGIHRGIVERVEHDRVLIRVPRRYAPTLASAIINPDLDKDKRLALALAKWGYGYPAGGYRFAKPIYGAGWWAAGWLWWWLAFAWILALAAFWW